MDTASCRKLVSRHGCHASKYCNKTLLSQHKTTLDTLNLCENKDYKVRNSANNRTIKLPASSNCILLLLWQFFSTSQGYEINSRRELISQLMLTYSHLMSLLMAEWSLLNYFICLSFYGNFIFHKAEQLANLFHNSTL